MNLSRSNNRRAHRNRAIAGFTSAAVAISLMGLGAGATAAAAEEIPAGHLIAHYDFEGNPLASPTLADRSGSARNATIINPGNATVVDGAGGAGTSAILLPGGASNSTGTYVDLPLSMLQGRTSFTVSVRAKNSAATSPWQWILGLGRNTTQYLLLTPRTGDGTMRSAITTSGGGGEKQITSTAPLAANEWRDITLTLDTDADLLTGYMDGAKLGSVSTTITGAQLVASATRSGYIGRSFYADPRFQGAIDDFKFYDIALTGSQVAEIIENDVPTALSPSQTSFDVRTNLGTAPVLPPTVDSTFTDGFNRPAEITWDAVPPSAYAARGRFTVNGTVAGSPVKALVRAVAPGELTIDLAENTGAFHGGASGTLYGLYGEGIPSNNLIEGMNLRTVSTKAQDGPQHPGADALEVVKPLADSTGGDVYIYMTDINRGFPYEWEGTDGPDKLDKFIAKISTQVDQVLELESEYQDNIVFVPFNEPEGNMFGTGQFSYNNISWLNNPQYYFAAWDEVYSLIKAKMPNARIAGPNTSQLFGQVEGFLDHAVAANTVPDVMTWHELSAPAQIRANVPRYRQMEARAFDGSEFEGTELPININEYAFNYHTSVPGQMIQWVSGIEDAKVDADIAYWNIDGNLSDSAVQANRGNGQWWLLNAYGQMTGNTVEVSPPSPNVSYTLQGLATLDSAKKQARALFGGAAGSAPVRFENVDADVFGNTVHAVIQEIGWSGQIGDSASPATIAEVDVPVVDGAATFGFGAEFPALKEESAYQIVLTPGENASGAAAPTTLFEATYEAETAAHTGTGWTKNLLEGSPADVSRYYTSGGYDVGGLRNGSDVTLDFAVTAPKNGAYDLSVFANSLNTYPDIAAQGPVNIFVRVDGGAEQEIYTPLGYKWVVWDHVDTKVDLTAGAHTITLAARSLDGVRVTKGDTIIDKIDLSLANPDATGTIYEAEYSTLKGAQLDYSQSGVSASGVAGIGNEESATFWVYSKADAASTLAFRTFGGGAGRIVVNGIDVARLGSSKTIDAFLKGGVNKIVVEGRTGNLLLDRLVVTADGEGIEETVYQAEDATVAGSAAPAAYSLADGGKAVTGIGGTPGNFNTLSFANVEVDAAGTYAMTVRYSNEEQSEASHYNPDPLARPADISINGGAAKQVLFPHSFHENNFWELTFPVVLEKGANTIEFSSEERLNFDGETYISETFQGILLRSQYAPNIDSISVAALVQSASPIKVTATTTPAAVNAAGWFNTPVELTLGAEGGFGDLTTEYNLDGSGWTGSTGPVTVSEDGDHTVLYRANSEEASSEEGSLSMKIDATAPLATAVFGDEARALTIEATDVTSGITLVEYALNGGAWATYEAPVNVGSSAASIDYRSTDAAGNVSATGSVTVAAVSAPVPTSSPEPTRSPVPVPSNTVPPTPPVVVAPSVSSVSPPIVRGSASLGKTLKASNGAWSPSAGLTFTYQWLADDKSIAGATGASYKLSDSRLGDRVAVRVTARLGAASATSVSKSVHVKATSLTTIKLRDNTITTKNAGKLTVTVKADGAGRETGKVVVHYGSKTKTVTLNSSDRGSVTVTLPKLKKGSYKVWAQYKGTSDVIGDNSIKKTLSVRKG